MMIFVQEILMLATCKGLMLSGSALGTTYQKCGQISGNKGAAQHCGVVALLKLEASAANQV